MNPLPNYLKKAGVLKTKALINAFEAIDRKDFVLPEFQDSAYEDFPLSIGQGQTISQPFTVAFMLELLHPQKGEKILDVGSGSGWTAALLAHVVGPQGKVYGVELVPELTEFGRSNIAKYNLPQAQIMQAERKTLGLPKYALFDKILVSAAAKEIPQALLSQLKENGVMVIPVASAILRIQKVPKKEPRIERFEGFVFVPLL